MNGTRKHREEGGESGNNSFTGPTTPPPPPPQFDVNSPAFLAALAAFQTMAGTNPMIPMLTMWQRPLLPQGSFNQGRPPFTPPGFSQPPPPPPPPPPSSALPQLRPPLSPSDWERLLHRQSELRTSLPNGVPFDLHHQQQQEQQQLLGLNENQMLEMFKQSLQNNEISPSLMRRIQEMRNSLRPGNTGPVRRKNSTRESTQVLKNWLNNHSHNPYPSKNEKYMLALAADMSLTQVSTWFANARRRLKKERRATWIGPSGLDHLFGEQGSPFMGASAQSNCDESEFEPESTGSQVNQSNGSSTLSESTQGVEDNDGMEKAENKKESEQIPAISQAVTPNKTSNKFWSVVDMTAES